MALKLLLEINGHDNFLHTNLSKTYIHYGIESIIKINILRINRIEGQFL